MPHVRSRHLSQLMQKTCAYSAITGLFGHRQVGKTTLASALAGQYVTLDSPAAQDQACRDPEGFLLAHSQKTPLVIDECQLAPPLFPVLKEHVRQHPKPGQFLLTGSVRFSSRKAIKESLTGRMIAWELLPMDLSELYESELPTTLIKMVQSKTVNLDLKPKKYFSQKSYQDYLQKGGLPGLFSVRDLKIREQKFETQINTMLERDLQLILQTTLPYTTLRLFFASLAQRQGHPLDLAVLSRQSRISTPTIRKLLTAFAGMFLIRLIPTRGSESKPVLFLEDQGEASFLMSGQKHELDDLLRFCFANFRVPFFYTSQLKVQFFQFRNRGGASVPLALQVDTAKSSHTLGIIPILGATPTPHDRGSAYSFLKTFAASKILFVTKDDVDRVLSQNMRIVSVGALV